MAVTRLPDPQNFATRLGSLGPDAGHTGGQSTTTRAACLPRDVWWMLRWIGHRGHVAVLDGGIQAWQTAGYPLSQQQPQSFPAHDLSA